MNIYLEPKFNSIIEINTEGFEVKKNHLLEVKNLAGVAIFKVYPAKISSGNKKYLPISFSLKENKNNELTSYCENLNILKIDSGNYLIQINPSFVSISKVPTVIAKRKINGKTASIFNAGESFFVLEDDEIIINYSFEEEVLSGEIFNISDYIVAISQTKNSSRCLVIDNFKNEIILDKKCFKCEFSTVDNILKILTNTKNCIGCGLVTTYSLEKEFKEINSYSVEMFKAPKNFAKELKPIALFDAVKTKNFNLAKSFLSETLKNEMEDEHLTAFFLPYSSLVQNKFKEENEYLMFSNPKSNPPVHINFLFNLNDEIDNIVEI